MGRRLALSCSAAAVLLLAACGGPGRLTGTAFRARANAVCTAYRTGVRAHPLPASDSLPSVARYARATLPLYRRALAQLEALRPPRADEERFVRLLALDRRIARDVRALAAAAESGRRPDLAAALARARRDDRAASRLAAQLGLAACAR